MNPPIIGVSKQILQIKELISHVADTCLNILITGETGVGKEVIAHSLYRESPRSSNSFIKINCAALPETLLESELFGYESGAFTGARKKRRGKFQMADKGVLFLDEIGDMPIALQSKILHVLQSGEFSPLGSDQEIQSDVWLIAATNHNLEKKIKKKEFREDLFYRLNIIKIYIPPLRERPDDVQALIEYYLEIYTEEFPDRDVTKPDETIMKKLKEFPWPGNVRQLQNSIKKQVVLNDWGLVLEELHSSYMDSNKKESITVSENESSTFMPNIPQQFSKSAIIEDLFDKSQYESTNFEDISLKKIKKRAVNKVEKEVIGYVLGKTGWNRSKASKILKISYKTLLSKISELGITPPSIN